MAKKDEDVPEVNDDPESDDNLPKGNGGKKKSRKVDTRYHRSLVHVFQSHHKPGAKEIAFKRDLSISVATAGSALVGSPIASFSLL